ncbi:uncharacterized protein LOC120000343 isoform X2 [Tripterygium wilfordii]|uniref:uncharacterized protein LOC119999264 isoform X2 n=1 Tax=Tripterygium wilfordii TaxID=458696 RepID=UPI0018F8575B|nr:uncharacterized protein LOC119999264 isoform X2 [Tripterygium wilfordii]XP_038704312.1 uncharacterized protein LOC120000343 isoform X2 [Tripterygium wilfordii]
MSQRELIASSLRLAKSVLSSHKEKFLGLKKREGDLVKEAEAIMAHLAHFTNLFAYSGFFTFIPLKATLSCFSLLSAVLLSLLLLSSMVWPIMLARRRFKGIFLDFNEIAEERENLLATVEEYAKMYNDVMNACSYSDSILTDEVKQYFDEVDDLILKLKEKATSPTYATFYTGCLRSLSFSVIVYAVGVFWLADWKCEALHV